jgi:hypothetical protein
LNPDYPLVCCANDDPNPAIREEVGHTVLAEIPAQHPMKHATDADGASRIYAQPPFKRNAF